MAKEKLDNANLRELTTKPATLKNQTRLPHLFDSSNVESDSTLEDMQKIWVIMRGILGLEIPEDE